ncbi:MULTISPECIES: hypothetical protein [unclassified Sphingomonas]|uniref:hypothetical protein n=1 Tax=unclassified Sphingomonas TaxID=196159 RepID=UPI002150CABE|nr:MULTISPECIES: hypothetical protein [unclassified Sphingomonas]MCR5871467.1 hypothetical protein [Sphingomonas sp. J344]UUY00236.1 hypothetical protein LRS08_03685 [Sphingomonas sp. J315]
MTRISHDFTGIGAKLPQSAFPPAIEAMANATDIIQAACGLNIAADGWQEIGQDVEALD